MDRHSHGNKGVSTKLSSLSGSDISNESDMAGTGNFTLLGASDLGQKFSVPVNPYVISRAYSEPIGTDPIEQLILQRNYIID